MSLTPVKGKEVKKEEMVLSLDPLVANKSLSITCLDSYRNKLLVGTQQQGVLVYNIFQDTKGRFSAQIEQVRREITEGLRVDQISVVEQWASVLVLSVGELIICNFKIVNGESLFSNQSTLMHKNISKFVVFVQGFFSPILCVVAPGHFYFYKSTGTSLLMFSKLDFTHQVLDMALTENNLFVVYRELGSDVYKSGCFALINKTFTTDMYPPQPLPPVVKSCGFKQVMFLSERTSTVYTDGTPTHTINWKLPPHDIKIWNQFCIAIQGDCVEIALLEGEHGKPTVSATLSDPALQFLTSTGHPYVATHNAVWRVNPPVVLDPPPPTNAAVPTPSSISLNQRWEEVREARTKEIESEKELRRLRLANLYESRKKELERSEQIKKDMEDMQRVWEKKKKELEERQQLQLDQLRVLELHMEQHKMEEEEAMWENRIKEEEYRWKKLKEETEEIKERRKKEEEEREVEQMYKEMENETYKKMYEKYQKGEKTDTSFEKVMDQIAENDSHFGFSPGDPLSALGMNKEGVDYFEKYGIRTVGQLAQQEAGKVRSYYDFKYWEYYKKAVKAMHSFDNTRINHPSSRWGELFWADQSDPIEEPLDRSPTDSIILLGMDVDDVDYLGGFGINTIADLAKQKASQITEYYGAKYWNYYKRSINIVKKHENKNYNALNPSYTNSHSYTSTTYQPSSFTSLTSFDPPIPQSNWDDYSVENKPKPKKEREIFGDLNPEDPLEALGIPEHQIEFLRSIDILTVRQFAQMHEAEVGSFDDELLARHVIAVECTKAHPEKAQKVINQVPEGTSYGYIYLPSREFDTIKADNTIKSSYVLFQEFVECAPDKRNDHPWKNVYLKYLPKATEHFKAQPGSEVILSDADVFSYLCWAHANSFGKLDVTAGARAIYFHWGKIHPQHLNFLSSLDLSANEPIKNNLVQINLTLLCHNYGGKLFNRMEQTGDGDWEAVILEDYDQAKEYHNQKGSESVYFSMPTGCIVLPAGTISSDCFITDRSKIS